MPKKPTLYILGVILVATLACIGLDKYLEAQKRDEAALKQAEATKLRKGLELRRRMAYTQALALARQGKYEQGAQAIYATNEIEPEQPDSAQMLYDDLLLVQEADKQLGELSQEQAQQVKAGTYQYQGLQLAISQTWYRQQLRAALPRLPQARAAVQRKRQEAYAASLRAERKSREAAVAEGRQGRISAAARLRDNFLDKGYNIKVKVSGLNKDVIELEYALFDEVWSYKMNQQGNIDELLDLGFKRVRLTDGYDYGVNWTRK